MLRLLLSKKDSRFPWWLACGWRERGLELTRKCSNKCRLAEAVGAGDLAVEFGFEVIDCGGAGSDFGDDLVLFGEGWDYDLHGLKVA